MRSDRSAARRGRVWRHLAGIRSAHRPTALAVALCAILGLAACGSSGSGGTGGGGGTSGEQTNQLFGSPPPVGTPSKGGTITVGQIDGATPSYIFPIVPAANTSAYTINFVAQMFLPLYNGPLGDTPEVNYSLSLAKKPIFSDGDKTVTIPLNTNYKWADGAPVQANDVIFAIDLMKVAVKDNPADWGQYVPGQFPTSVVTATAPDKYTVKLTLDKAYNPSYFLNNQLQVTNAFTPLPSTAWNIAVASGPHLDFTNPANALKIYKYLSKLGGSIGNFMNPLWQDVDGPFKLKDFNTTNSSYDLVPNPTYGGSPKPYVDKISVLTYTSVTAQLNALKDGQLDIGGVDFSQIPQIPGLKQQGYSVFGYPQMGYFDAVINFKDTTNHFDDIVRQLYIRQALAHLLDQPGYIRGIFKNAAVENYGPVPPVPSTPFTPANVKTNPYPYDPAAAVQLLKSHGWKVVPGGQTTCEKPGSGADECGAGIPAGTPFKFTFYDTPVSESPAGPQESEAFVSVAEQKVGINAQLVTKTFDYEYANFNDADPSDAKNENQWGIDNNGGLGSDYYPTSEGALNTGGGLNAGDYSDPQADQLMRNSVYGSDPQAVQKEATYLTRQVPALFMPNSDYIYAVSKRIGGQTASFLALTELETFGQYWYVNKKN